MAGPSRFASRRAALGTDQVRDLLRAVLDLLLELRELVHAALLGDQLELRPPHPSSAPDRAHSAHRRLAADPTLSPAISSLHCASCADTSTSLNPTRSAPRRSGSS
eukprot:3198699-Rhodomonas_salina.1